MIDFACKKFDVDEIIICSLGLTKYEFRILEFMIKNNGRWMTTHEIAEGMGIGLSTAQKAVKKLKHKNIVSQSQRNLEKGGYIFIYSIRDKEGIRKIIIRIVNDWVKKVETDINKW